MQLAQIDRDIMLKPGPKPLKKLLIKFGWFLTKMDGKVDTLKPGPRPLKKLLIKDALVSLC